MLTDGNCLFRAFSQCLFNTEEHHYEVRNLLVGFENPNQYVFAKHLPLRKSMKDHITKLCFPGSWGTDLEILAATSYYKIPAYFSSIDNTTKQWIWGCMKPLVAQFSWFSNPVVVESNLSIVPLPSHFELVYWSNTHYDSIISQDGDTVSTIPPLVKQKNYCKKNDRNLELIN